MMLDNDYLFYYDKKGRQFSIKQSEVKEMVVGPEYYSLLPISKKDKRLLKLIASNEKYLLSIYQKVSEYSVPNLLIVHDKKTKEIVDEKIGYFDTSTDYDHMLPIIKKYFGNCDDLLSRIDTNIKNQKKINSRKRPGPFFEINNLDCPE
jgi:hypothetical protein